MKSAGEMTLNIELYDSVTGDLIAKAMDRQIDNPSGPVYSLDQFGNKHGSREEDSEGLGGCPAGCAERSKAVSG